MKQFIIKIITVFRRVNFQDVNVNHKSHLCVNSNCFGYDIAVIMHVLKKQTSIFWLLTGPVTVNRLNISGCGQPSLKNARQRPLY